MRLDHEFVVRAPADAVLSAMITPRSAVGCMPGAKLRVIDGPSFDGTWTIQFGPVARTYDGWGTYVHVDRAAGVLRLELEGRDISTGEWAKMSTTVSVEPCADATLVRALADLTITGPPAELGRRVVRTIGDQLLAKYATRLGEHLVERREPTDDTPVDEPEFRESGRLTMLGLAVGGVPASKGEPDLAEWPVLDFAGDRVRSVAEAARLLGYAIQYRSDPTAEEMGRTVLEAVRERGPDDVLVVHVVGHGHLGASGSLYVVGADGAHGPGSDVEQWLRAVTDVDGAPMTLFLLDLCHSGAVARLPWQLTETDAARRAWVLAAAAPGGSAFDGRFSLALAEVLQLIADPDATSFDLDPAVPSVPLSTVARELRRTVTRIAVEADGLPQSVVGTRVDIAADVPVLPFFPHLRHRPATERGFVGPLATFIESAGGPARGRDGESPPSGEGAAPLSLGDAHHFVERGAGGPPAHPGELLTGLFTGRRRELRTLSTWFDGRDSAAFRVVTGTPGVGKSALLGVLVCAAHPALRQVTAPIWSGVDTFPYENRHLAAVSARQRSSAEVAAQLMAQLGGDEDQGNGVEELLRHVRAARETVVLVIDAVDEATDPVGLATRLVLPLADLADAPGGGRCRLLVATRPWPELDALLGRARVAGALTDLDQVPPPTLRYDIERYAEHLLRSDPRYDRVDQAGGRSTFAAALAARLVPDDARTRNAWGEFLVAGMYTRRMLLLGTSLNDVGRARELGDQVPTELPQVLELDIADLDDGAGSASARPVLEALALGRGDGLPARLVECLARRLATRRGPGTSSTVMSTLDEVNFYLRRAVDDDGSTQYRLFHQGLVDHLRPHDVEVESLVVDAFLDQVATPAGRDWDLAEPYLFRHLLDHAATAGRRTTVLADVEFVVRAELSSVVAHAGAEAPDGERPPDAATLVQGLAEDDDFVRAGLDERRRRLALAAARAHAPGAVPSQGGLLRPVRALGAASTAEPFETALSVRYRSDHVVLRPRVGIRSIAVSEPDPGLVAVAGADGTVTVWDVAGCRVGEPVRVGDEPPSAMTLQANAERVVLTVGAGGSVHQHDVVTGDELRQWRLPRGEVVDAVVASSRGPSEWVVATTRSGLLTGMTPAMAEPSGIRHEPTRLVRRLRSPGGDVVVTAHRADPAGQTTIRVFGVALTPTANVLLTRGPTTVVRGDLLDLQTALVGGKPAVVGLTARDAILWRFTHVASSGVRTRALTGRDDLVALLVDDRQRLAVVTAGGHVATLALPDLTMGDAAEVGPVSIEDLVLPSRSFSPFRGPDLAGPGDAVPVTAIGGDAESGLVAVGFADGGIRVGGVAQDRAVVEPLGEPIMWVGAVRLAGRGVVLAKDRAESVGAWDAVDGSPLGSGAETRALVAGLSATAPRPRWVRADGHLCRVDVAAGVVTVSHLCAGPECTTRTHRLECVPTGDATVAVVSVEDRPVLISGGEEGDLDVVDLYTGRSMERCHLGPVAISELVGLPDGVAVRAGGEVVLFSAGRSRS